MTDNNRIIIFDTTLTEGVKIPEAIINQAKKLKIASRLEDLGVDVIEAGFPAASSFEYESVKAISLALKKAQVAALCRTNTDDIRYAWKAIRDGKQPRLHTFMNTCDQYMSQQLNMSENQAIDHVVKGIKLARSFTENVGFMAKDAFQSDKNFLCRLFAAVIQAGADTITLADTSGHTIPEELGSFIQYIQKQTPGMDQMVLGVRCYNDLGLATANTLCAITNGAGQVEVTINGIGKRAGNTSMEEVVMALYSRSNIFPRTTGIDTTKLYSINRMVSMMSGIPILPNRPILGANVFSLAQTESDQGEKNYTPILPETIGINTNLFLHKDSDQKALNTRIWEMGYELTEEEENNIFFNFKKLADKKPRIQDEDIVSLIEEEMLYGAGKFFLDYVQVSCGTTTYPTATVQILINGQAKRGCMEGIGPMDAIFKTIRMLTQTHAEFLMLQAASITKGMDAQVKISLRLSENGLVVLGNGTHSDIIIASSIAYINGLNRLEFMKKGSQKNRNNFFQNRFS